MKIDVFQERYPQQVEAEVVLLFMDAFSAPPRYEEWDEASARDAIRKDYDPDAIFIAVSVLVVTMAAGLYPAWKAGRVEPVETIRLV